MKLYTITLTLFLFISVLVGQPTFIEHNISTTSQYSANSVHAADVDGDGDMDVLSASGGDDKVAWYENDGSGSFTEHVISTSADNAFSVYAADVDGDGDMDVLSASYYGDKIAWYENDGNESFTEQIISTSADGPQSVYATDVDGDGDMDVLSAGDGDITWYENDGSESFTEHVISTPADYAHSVYAADVDGDGDMDVLSASSGGPSSDDKIAWYENDGSQSFTEHVISTSAPGAWSVYAADVDSDGDMDVLSGSSSDYKIAWYENDGSQGFTEHVISTIAQYATSVYAADLDGDSDMDVLFGTWNDYYTSWGGNPDIVAWCENDGSQNFTYHTIATSEYPYGVMSVYAADVDGDGDMDVLSAGDDDGQYLNWYEQEGSPEQDNPPEVGDIPGQTVNEGEAFSIFDLDDYLTELDGDSVAWSYSIPGQEPDPVFVVIATHDTTVYPLQIGFSLDATDGFDFGIDLYAPPAPPPPSFDAALGWNSDRYYTQIVSDDGDNSEHVFDIQLQYPESNLITLTWDNTGWSDLGSFILQDAFDGLLGIDIDMTQETSLTLDNPALNTLKWKVTPTYLQGETQTRDLMVDIDEENVATVTYSDGWSGSEEVIFTAKDQTEAGLSDSDGATFTVIANTPPVADDIAVTTNEDMAVDIILTGSDAESGVLAYHVVASPTGGILTGEADSLLYTPDENYNGGDSFNYFVSDGIDSSNVATVSITVNPADDSPEVAEIPDQSVNDGEEFEPFDLDDYLTELDEDEVTWSYEIEGQEPEPGFAVSLQTVGGFGGYDLTIGFSSNATDGYDEGIDQYAPPAPPPPAFDAALGWGGDRYYTQILADDGDYSEHVFDVQFAYSADNLITLTWDNTGWSDLGTFILQDAFDGLLGIDVDMTQENSLTLDNPALNTLKWKVTPTSLEGDSQNRDLTVDIDEENVVMVTYPTGWIGSEGIIFIVTDETEAALSDSENVMYTVSPVDDPPIVEDIPDQTVTTPEQFTTFDLDEYLTELDGDDIVWSYEITSNDGPSYPTFVLNAAGGDLGTSYDLTVGFSEDATDGYDEGIDIYAPPAPPPPSFDAALGWLGDRYYTQVLADDGDYTEHVFDVQLAYPADNLITLTWDNTGWADLGTFILQDAFGGLLGIDVDMTQENSLTLDNPALNTLKWMVTPMETDGGGEEEGLSVTIDSSNVATVTYTAGWTGSGEITFIAIDQTATALSGLDNAIFTVEPSVAIVEEVGIPTVFTLHQNYPNPFNPVTTLRYDLPDNNHVRLTIYDLNGKEINHLVNTSQPAGHKSVQWNATDSFGKPVSAGVYLYQIRSGEFVQTKKMVLLK